MAYLPLLVFFSLTHLLLLSISAEEKKYNPRCPPFPCGDLGLLKFPYNSITSPECGVLTVDCSGHNPKIKFKEGGHLYNLTSISQADSIVIDEKEPQPFYSDHLSCEKIRRLSLPSSSSIFSLDNFRGNSFTLYNCSHGLGLTKPKIFNEIRCGDYDIYYHPQNLRIPFKQHCSINLLPLPVSEDHHHPNSTKEVLLSTKFTLVVRVSPDCGHCHYDLGGKCETNSGNQFYCSNARKGKNSGKEFAEVELRKLGLGLGIGLGVGVPLALICLVLLIRCWKPKLAASKFLSRNNSDPYINSDPEGASAYFGVPVFSYKDLDEATNNFNAEKELGDGGFGTVYHGKLKDGREVAVKRLYEHNYKRVEQFINEIEILTRLRHKNLVSLYGCTSRHSRELLLVYEFIPNGTVADHLHGDRAKIGVLTWPIRMSIAIETASALAYLHASDIVHRDVKTNNILLDDNFCVKVADFGLSRLFPNDVTHVSTAPQGTPGYVDPEYHQCYQLTSKSDVYSFGVVLVELISSMPAVDITRHRHEINLSNLAISKIQKRAYNELVDPYLGFDSNNEVKTMIIAVAELAFQCLQQDTEMRPSMDEVLEILNSIRAGNNETHNDKKDESFDDSGLTMSTVRPPPSPDCDEVGLLKRMRQEQPPSPNTVTENWPSSRSATPNISG